MKSSVRLLTVHGISAKGIFELNVSFFDFQVANIRNEKRIYIRIEMKNEER